LLALPAIPLAGALAMTGAVALGAHPTSPHASRHDVATRPVSRETPGQITHTATTTFRRLEKVVTANPGRSQVVSLGTRLHAQLSALLVTDSGDPRRIGEVRQLLSAEQRLLEGHPAPGVALVLAQSRTLAKLLPHNLSPTPPPPSLPTVGLPAPTSSSVQAKAPKQRKIAKQTPSLPTATSSPTTHPSTSPSHSTHSGDGDNSNDNGSSPGDLIDPKLLSSAL
jgi:hypothetical protein